MLACASSCLSNSSIVSVSTAARAFLFVYSFFFFFEGKEIQIREKLLAKHKAFNGQNSPAVKGEGSQCLRGRTAPWLHLSLLAV